MVHHPRSRDNFAGFTCDYHQPSSKLYRWRQWPQARATTALSLYGAPSRHRIPSSSFRSVTGRSIRMSRAISPGDDYSFQKIILDGSSGDWLRWQNRVTSNKWPSFGSPMRCTNQLEKAQIFAGRHVGGGSCCCSGLTQIGPEEESSKLKAIYNTLLLRFK